MGSLNMILEDDSLTEAEKLEKVNKLLDIKLELKDKENINIDKILNISTENFELKCEVLWKSIVTNINFEKSIEYFIKYFKITFPRSENHKLLAKFLRFTFELTTDQDQVQVIFNQVGMENMNELILNDMFLQKSNKESDLMFKAYFKYLSVDGQAKFFNDVFKFSKTHQNVDFMYQILDNINQAALTHEESVFLSEDFWYFLTNYLVSSDKYEDTKKVISVFYVSLYLTRKAKLKVKVLNMDGDEKAWDSFFALLNVFNDGQQELIKQSLELLKYTSSLEYLWQDCLYKILLKHVPRNLKCTVLAYILKQRITDKDAVKFFKLIFSAINEQRCGNRECPVFIELNRFCDTTTVKTVSLILEEFLNIRWSRKLVWTVVGSVLVESKKNLVDFKYLPMVLRHLETYDMGYPFHVMAQISTFFCDPENLDFWRQISESSIPFHTRELPISEQLKNMAISKLVELSDTNCDDLLEIQIFLGFLRDSITQYDLINNYPICLHVRLVIYGKLFTIGGYHIAQTKLDQDKTVNDFYEYLVKHLNEKTYVAYRELMLSFLELRDRFMSFKYPEKACSEFLKIIYNPKLYTKYQIYCTTEILRIVNYRFTDLSNPYSECYIKIAQIWEPFILETEDQRTCKYGLYFVLSKGRLSSKEYNKLVKKLLDKHLCDEVAEEIYDRYLNGDLMTFALTRLKEIMEYSQEKYDKLSMLFCKAALSKEHIESKQFSMENEEFKFCCSNSSNLENSLREVEYNLLNYSENKEFRKKFIDLTLEMYLSKFINIKTKAQCLYILMRIVVRCSYPGMPKNFHIYFKEDLKWIMKRFKEKYIENLENDIARLRIIQGLFLLIPYVRLDFDSKFRNVMLRCKENIYKTLRKRLKRIAVGILVKESGRNNFAVRQICQLMYILLFQSDGTFGEIQCIIEKVKEHPNLTDSFMPVLYHVVPLCKISQNEMEEIFESIVLLSSSSNNKVKFYAQTLLQRLHILYNGKKYEDLFEKHRPKLELINRDNEINRNQIVDILKTDYLFLKVLDPIRDHSLETVLYILPKLNQVHSSEWKDAVKGGVIQNSKIDEFTIEKDQNETLKKAVETFLEPMKHFIDQCENYSAEDILKMFQMTFAKHKLLI